MPNYSLLSLYDVTRDKQLACSPRGSALSTPSLPAVLHVGLRPCGRAFPDYFDMSVDVVLVQPV